MAMNSPHAIVANNVILPETAMETLSKHFHRMANSGAIGSGPDSRVLNAIESSLNARIDVYRDRLQAGFPREAFDRLENLLGALPVEATPYIVHRIKANLGHCLLQLNDKEGGLAWLEDAAASAPNEPKAIATKGFTFIVRNDYAGAIEFARRELAANADNEDLVAHVIEACGHLDDANPRDVVPAAMLERERSVVALCIFHRARDDQPAWWAAARHGSRRYPDNRFLKLFAAESHVDEIARATRNEIYRPLTAAERTTLAHAGATLGAVWTAMKRSETPARDDALAALSSAMVAHRLLEEGPAAATMASDLIDGSDFEPALVIAVQVALAFGDDETAGKGLAKLSDTGPGGFLKGLTAVNKGDWESAAALFSRCEIPEPERPFADIMVRLAPFRQGDDLADEGAIETLRVAASSEPRSLIVIAKLALNRGFEDLSERAYKDAVGLIGPDMLLPARTTIAAHAYGTNDHVVVIRALDDFIDTGAMTEELQWLADAHASEMPPRSRNARFFEKLPASTRNVPSISRAQACVLTNARRYPEAETVLQRLVRETPEDPLCHLLLAQTYRRTNRTEEAVRSVVAADETAFVGPPSYRMQWAHELREVGQLRRALDLAYGLLRSFPDRPQMSLGYVGLVFGDPSHAIIPHQKQAGPGCWVSISEASGRTDSFIIDEGASFLGLDVVPPDSDRAKNVIGLGIGGTFLVSGILGRATTWTVKEIKSKYLHVLHTVLQDFEKRFPSVEGLWQFTMQNGDVEPALDIVRESAKARRDHAERLYVNGNMPLCMAAASTGSDVFSFAQYVRFLGFEIATSNAALPDRTFGIDMANRHRGKGAVLDTYTAATAAEYGALDILKQWFGHLSVAVSTIDEIDALIAKVAAGRGAKALTMDVVDDRLVAEQITDEIRDRQREMLEGLKGKIKGACEVRTVTLPDDAPDEIADYARTMGPHAFDAMYLASTRSEVLVSDDFHYRRLAAGLAKTEGAWVQAAILAARGAGVVDKADETKIVVALADLRHSHLWLDLASLLTLFDEASDEGFSSACRYVGIPGADMQVHSAVVSNLLNIIWNGKDQGLKRETRTSRIVECLLRHTGERWPLWFGFVYLHADPSLGLRQYLLTWLRGRCLPVRPVVTAIHWLVQRLGRGPSVPPMETSILPWVLDNDRFLSVAATVAARLFPRGGITLGSFLKGGQRFSSHWSRRKNQKRTRHPRPSRRRK